MVACDLCGENFRNNSTLKYHNQVWYCEACDSNFECESDFIDHASHLDHWLVKNLRPNWTAKIPLEAFEKSTVKANDDEYETKVDEASADGEHNVDDTLLKKPMLQTGSNEEIENCSMHSEDISNDDIESLEELSHKVDIKG